MIEDIRAKLQNPSDLYSNTLDNGTLRMEDCFFPYLCDQGRVNLELIVPFTYRFHREAFDRVLRSHPCIAVADGPGQWTELLLKGLLLFQIEGAVYRFDVQRKLFDKPDAVQIENTLQGPQSALT